MKPQASSLIGECRWSLQIADALNYLHGLSPRIIFRDLSAANVLLTSTRMDHANAKLVDFGLAKEAPRRNSQTLLDADGETQPCPVIDIKACVIARDLNTGSQAQWSDNPAC